VLRRRADACAEGFTMTSDLPPDLLPLALPEAALDAIAGALIDNARQAGAQAIAFAARALPASGMVRITATDDGPGIAPGDRERVFEPFFTTRRASGGSGLGLPIILSLVVAAGGSLRLADNEAGDAGGACFVLELPVAASSAA
jgi:signal transduction histidine kinase